MRAGASSVAAVLRMKEGTASGPVALWGFRFFKSLWTPFQSHSFMKWKTSTQVILRRGEGFMSRNYSIL